MTTKIFHFLIVTIVNFTFDRKDHPLPAFTRLKKNKKKIKRTQKYDDGSDDRLRKVRSSMKHEEAQRVSTRRLFFQ